MALSEYIDYPGKVFWRDHETTGDQKRVWTDRDPSDVFAIIGRIEWATIKVLREQNNLAFEEACDDD